MSEITYRPRVVRIAALAVAASATLVAVPFAAAPAHAADPVEIQLLNINDFHGRIDANTTKFATTVENLRASVGEANTLFLSDGDNIGASLFTSDVQQDKPTLDVLNTLDLAASGVGNHEFDKGFDDLDGRVDDQSEFSYLGANVYEVGTTTPALQEYETFEVDGLTVGVIGAVTAETPTLVSPGGIETIEFGDPVEAVNRVAAQLSDGDPANGEADVIVAEYHEGAGAGTPDGSTLAEEVAAGGAFADIVTATAAEVDVIFTGHTHKQYAWDAPVPGGDGTRPVLQTGSYGEFIGQVVLSVDPATGDVVSYTQQNVPRAADANLDLPRVAEVKRIVDEAAAYAKPIGDEPVGTIPADVTTAHSGGAYTPEGYAGGTRDDRASESTLGNLVATALREGVDSAGGADIGIVNPGGLRSDLLYAGNVEGDPANPDDGNPANTDGVVTYAEANAVLPFANSVFLVELTGADLLSVLEQQWQRNADGTVPSRPFLNLGLSDNVDVVYDPDAAEGSRITGFSIDGTAVDPAATYTVSTFSFLAQGGDNFRAFRNGTFTDVNLLDRELLIDHLESGLDEVDHTERQVALSPALPTTVQPDEPLSFTSTQLGLTSLGSPEVTEVTASLAQGDTLTEFASVPVSDRSASVTVTVPASARAGQKVVFRAGGTVLGEVEVVAATTPEPPAESIGVFGIVKPDPPYRYVRAGSSKSFVVLFLGYDARRVSGTVTVTARKFGTSQPITRVVEYRGRLTRMATPTIPSAGGWQITVTFVPDNEAYQQTTRSWWLWATPRGRH